MAIVLKHGHRLTLRTARILIASLWIAATTISFFPIIFWGKYHEVKKSHLCKPRNGRFVIFLTIVSFLIPLSIMVFCYVKIFLKVHRHKRTITQSLGESARLNYEYKTTKIVFTVLAVFVTLWTPYMIIYASSLNSNNAEIIPRSLFQFCGFLPGLHSMSNAIIYLAMTKNFRGTAIKLLRKNCLCVNFPEV